MVKATAGPLVYFPSFHSVTKGLKAMKECTGTLLLGDTCPAPSFYYSDDDDDDDAATTTTSTGQ